MATRNTLQELAGEAGGWFETAKRTSTTWSTDGRDDETTSYVRTKEGAPEWVRELVRAAHGAMLPDDWRYGCIRAALEAIAEADDVDDARAEFADDYVDIYTSALLEWVASHGSRPGYCDEAVEDFGAPDDDGIMKRLQLGQYAEAEEVYGLVLRSLEQRRDELEGVPGDDYIDPDQYGEGVA